MRWGFAIRGLVATVTVSSTLLPYFGTLSLTHIPQKGPAFFGWPQILNGKTCHAIIPAKSPPQTIIKASHIKDSQLVFPHAMFSFVTLLIPLIILT